MENSGNATPFFLPSSLGALNRNKLQKMDHRQRSCSNSYKKVFFVLKKLISYRNASKSKATICKKKKIKTLITTVPLPSLQEKKERHKNGSANYCRTASFPASVISLSDVCNAAYAFTFFLGDWDKALLLFLLFYLDFLLK